MTNIAMENHHAINRYKPSISMSHLYHGYMLVITRLGMIFYNLVSIVPHWFAPASQLWIIFGSFFDAGAVHDTGEED